MASPIISRAIKGADAAGGAVPSGVLAKLSAQLKKMKEAKPLSKKPPKAPDGPEEMILQPLGDSDPAVPELFDSDAWEKHKDIIEKAIANDLVQVGADDGNLYDPVTLQPIPNHMLDEYSASWQTQLADGQPSVSAGAVDVFDTPGWHSISQDNLPSWMRRGEPPFPRKPEENVRDYVARLRFLSDDKSKRGGVATSVLQLESELADNLKSGKIGPLGPQKPYTQDYIDYLAAHGVDQRTLDDIASGSLSMDPQARIYRAEQHGLDPKAIWHRWDFPLKTKMKGFTGAALAQPELRRHKQGVLKMLDLSTSKEGLVYTSHHPDYAMNGVQIPRDQVTPYPLLGPSDGIAGIDEMTQQSHDAFRNLQSRAVAAKYPLDEQAMTRRAFQRQQHLAEPIGWTGEPSAEPIREASLKSLRRITPDSSTSGEKFSTFPHYSAAENRKVYTEPLMASGAKGTLVRDETGLSTAFTPAGARTLRRADLAPLDTRFKDARNILQSLLVPALVGGGAATAARPGVLDGLRETR